MMFTSKQLITVAFVLVLGIAVGANTPQTKNKVPANFGTSPEVSKYYKSNTFNCFSSGKKIPIEHVNDDYCDCEDGSDEPGTSACSNGHFYCVNKGYRAESIASPLVNDGVCDCCDGSDEYEKKIDCPNNCKEKGSVMRKEREEKIERYKQGLKKKAELVEEAKSIAASKKSDLEKLKKDVDPLKEKIKELEVKKGQLEKQRDEEKKRLEEERDAAKKLEESNEKKEPEIAGSAAASEEGKEEEKKEKEEEVHSDLLDSVKKGNGESEGVNAEVKVGEENRVQEEEEEEDDGPSINIGKRSRNINDIRNARRRRPNNPPSPPTTSSTSPSSSSPSSSLWDYIPQSIQSLLKYFSKYLPKQLTGGGEDLSDVEGLLATARHELKEKEEQIEKIEKLFTYDHGKDNVYLPLYGKCFDAKTREYTYTLCPYDRASQGGTSLGKWEEWKDGYSIMSFQNGLQCWGGPKRSLTVSVECGSENYAFDVNEPSKCEYTMKFQTPAACDDEHLKVLQLEEDHVF